MGTVLSVFRAGPGAAVGTTRELGGKENAAVPADSAKSSVASVASTPGRDAGTKSSVQQMEKDWPPDNCGIEEYEPGVEVRDWEGPQRIKESQLSAEQQTSFRAVLAKVFHPDSIMGMKASCDAYPRTLSAPTTVYHPDEVLAVVDTVIPYLESEPMLIEDVPFGVTIVGDLHGQLYDLDRVFRGDSVDGKPGWECTKYLFLGNFVDRGRQSLEVMLALYCIKMLYPDRIFLLRGNHEFTKVNLSCGFFLEVQERYNEDVADILFKKINESFMWLSIAAIVGNIYYCANGGISPGATRYRMRGIYKPYHNASENMVILDTTGCDPAVGLKGSAFNRDHNYVGFDEICYCLACMEVVAIFRGHTMIKTGYDVTWNLMFTVFTATDYSFGGNQGAVAVVDEKGKVGFRILEVDKERAAWERTLRKLEFDDKLKGEQKAGNDDIEKNDGKLQEM